MAHAGCREILPIGDFNVARPLVALSLGSARRHGRVLGMRTAVSEVSFAPRSVFNPRRFARRRRIPTRAARSSIVSRSSPPLLSIRVQLEMRPSLSDAPPWVYLRLRDRPVHALRKLRAAASVPSRPPRCSPSCRASARAMTAISFRSSFGAEYSRALAPVCATLSNPARGDERLGSCPIVRSLGRLDVITKERRS